MPPATVVEWLGLVRDAGALERLLDADALVRIESFGESFAVEKGLLRLGWEDARALRASYLEPRAIDALVEDRGLLRCPRQMHCGWLRLLGRLDQTFAARPRWRVLNPVADLVALFDKRVTSRRYRALGVPVPTPLEGVHDLSSLRAAVRAAGATSAWIKLSCGSSASGLAVYRAGRARSDGECADPDDGADTSDGEHCMTTMRATPAGYCNSLVVQRVADGERLRALVEYLLREGAQVELDVPKARLDGAFFDCRVLMVAGQSAFTVVRQSRHPITNLHLGGWRGELSSLERALPATVKAAAMESCRRVASAHGCLHVGVDLLYEAGYRGHRVVEANAFGDLLPNLEREGLSVYEWEIRAALHAATM